MLLNNIEDIKEWMTNNTDLYTDDYEIVFNENINNYIVNTKCSICIDVRNETINIPVKFGNIEGNYDITNVNEKKIKEIKEIYWPNNIKMNLYAVNFNLTLEWFKNWNIESIGLNIFICGKYAELDNLDFLENTNFKKIFLKMENTPFKDDIIPENYKKVLGYNETLTKEELMKIIVNKDAVLDYFNFENNFTLDKE